MSKKKLFVSLSLLFLYQTAWAQTSASNKLAAATADVIDWTIEKPEVPRGEVRALSVQDNQYNRQRKIWIYTPPNYDSQSAEPYGLMISFDGDSYINDIPAPVILDNLLAAGKIYPIVAVMVDNSEDRLGDLANHQKFADFLAKDLVPYLQKNYHVAKQSGKNLLVGYSAGGLAAAFAAFRYPNWFGNVLSQSGAFWRGNEGGTAETEWLTAQYRNSPKQNTRFYIEVGAAETGKTVAGISLVEANRHLRDVLGSKGFDIRYTEVPNAVHNPVHWRAQLADGIIYLMGKSL